MKIKIFFQLVTGVFACLSTSISTAQAGNLVSGNIGGEYRNTVNYEYFTLKKAGITTIDVDAFGMDFGNGKSKLNPYIYLFKDDGWWGESDFIAKSSMFDRKIAENKSPTLFDPYISQFLEAGNYFVAISGGDFTLQESLTEENDDTSFGDYQIRFSNNVIAQNAVIEDDDLPLPSKPILEKDLLSQPEVEFYANKFTPTNELTNKTSVPEPSSILGLLLVSIYSGTSFLNQKKSVK